MKTLFALCLLFISACVTVNAPTPADLRLSTCRLMTMSINEGSASFAYACELGEVTGSGSRGGQVRTDHDARCDPTQWAIRVRKQEKYDYRNSSVVEHSSSHYEVNYCGTDAQMAELLGIPEAALVAKAN